MTWQQTIAAFFHWLTTTRYTRWLEGEVDRLRAANQGLMNSLLGTGGIAPIDFERGAPKQQKLPEVKLRQWGPAWNRKKEAESVKRVWQSTADVLADSPRTGAFVHGLTKPSE